ncbi:acyl carrier protein [Butyrivibrio sp. CB08]|uniref:acyl carrier protein n=1 Tax=Butyrivibrio sp. CB08 TaxID=2364879 RepID=UPI003FA47588
MVTKKFKTTSQKEAEKMKDVKGTIIRIIAEYLDKDENELSGSSSFTEIGLDSLDIMELVMQMQEELDCKIELSQEITTIDSLVALIEQEGAKEATA